MERLNMLEYLLHGIKPYRFHAKMTIDHISDYHKLMIEDAADILKQILDYGFIACRNDLKNILTDEEYLLMNNLKRPNWNGQNSISITKHKDVIKNDWNYIDIECAYTQFVSKYPAIILNSNLLDNLNIDIISNRSMIGEIQITDRIPIDYIKGICLPNINLNYSLIKVIKHNLSNKKLDFNLPLNISIQLSDLLELTEEEFVQRHYYDVDIFEQVLKTSCYNLKLYHTSTGFPILTVDEEIEFIKKLKKKYI